MEFDEFVRRTMRQHGFEPHQRTGQLWFNSLYMQRPDLADLVRDTDADPFYNDKNLAKFFEVILENW